MALQSMRLVELTDRNLLAVLVEVADGSGEATAEAIANKLGIKAHNPRQCVSVRLSWLKRYGMLEGRREKGDPEMRWSLTRRGRDLYTGRLKATTEKALSALDGGEVWMAASLVTRRYDALDDTLASMVRRDFQHQQQRRRLRQHDR